MSNHWHVVLNVDSDKVEQLSQQEVISRWRKLYAGNVLMNRYLKIARSGVSSGDTLDVDRLRTLMIKSFKHKGLKKLFIKGNGR